MTTYYVDGAVGSDVNDGLAEGAGNAWATIDHAMNNVVANDHVYVKASATYAETPNLDTAGGTTTNIIFEGYTTTPGDGGRATINSGGNYNLTSSLGNAYYIFRNFRFTGAISHGLNLGSTSLIAWINCEFDNNGGDGISCHTNHYFYECEAYGNTIEGIDANSCFLYHNKIYSNGNQGASGGSGPVIGNLIYENGGGGSHQLVGAFPDVHNNTIDGAGTTASCISNSNNLCRITNNICRNATTGVSNSNTTRGAPTYHGYNAFDGITNKYANPNQQNVGLNDVEGDVNFTDEANDDYTLGVGSIAKGAAMQVR